MATSSDEYETEKSDHNSSMIMDSAGRTEPVTNRADPAADLRYRINDSPPWYLCIMLGFQHYLTMFGATMTMAVVLAPALCIAEDGVAKSEIMGTLFFVAGLVTILQATLGVRLPIIQGGTFSFLLPTFSLLSLPQWACPNPESVVVSNITDGNNSYTNQTLLPNSTTVDDSEIWKSRMREIQGAIIVASLVQVFVGATGIIGLLLRFIGPLTIAPIIALIGLSLFPAGANFSSEHWGIASLTMFLVVLFSQYLRNVNIPCCGIRKKESKKAAECYRVNFPFFKMFPVILAVTLSWVLCGILTVTDVLPTDPSQNGYYARTDTKLSIIYKSSWIRVPYPFQWGMPTVSVAGSLAMMAGVIAGMLESVGDYYACARMSGAPPPPVHAINRGILMEGIGCVLSGMYGTGTGTTSYSENVGAIGITKVGSRRVIQTAGLIMMCMGILGKFGALFVTIPEPVIGGMFMVMFGVIAAVGISNLQYVDLNSSRNLFIFGFSVFVGLSVPFWLESHPNAINTGIIVLDQILTVLLKTSMFIGGILAFILDNTVPGTLEERGINAWRAQMIASSEGERVSQSTLLSKCYDFPCGMSAIRRWKWTKYVPVCPTFKPSGCQKRSKSKSRDSYSESPMGEGDTNVVNRSHTSRV